MTVLYWMAGSGIGLTVLFLYLKRVMRQREVLLQEKDILVAQKDYRNEVIEQLSEHRNIDDTVNRLQSGEF